MYAPRAVVATILLILAHAACPSACAGEQAEAFAAIPARMQQFVADREIAGAVTLVGNAEKVVNLAAVGKADVEADTPMTADAMFGVMSMTKPITATALMILVDEGKVDLDDSVEKYIPAFADAKTAGGEPVKGLTIRRLLTHSAGLVGDQGCRDSLEATANALARRPFGYQPGDRWEYSPALNVCGRIIEVASRQPYEQFLAERIFKPLGMNDTTFHLSDAQRARLAQLYERTSGGKLTPARRWGDAGSDDCVPNPSGGLFSTAADMGRFYQLVLNGGALRGRRVVSADAVKQMTTVQYPDLVTGFTPGNGWGLGWCVVRKPENVTGMLSPGTFGHGGAYGTQGWVDPERKTIFVLMIQRSNLPNSDASDIRKEFQRLAVEGRAKSAKN
jgi:CubicO group peptidase (beta-lactamase class C family)